jgi:hypothetical protein
MFVAIYLLHFFCGLDVQGTGKTDVDPTEAESRWDPELKRRIRCTNHSNSA